MEWMEFYFLKVNFAPSILKKGAYKHKTGRLKTSQNNLILISSIVPIQCLQIFKKYEIFS